MGQERETTLSKIFIFKYTSSFSGFSTVVQQATPKLTAQKKFLFAHSSATWVQNLLLKKKKNKNTYFICS